MANQIIETIRQDFQFENQNQYLAFDEMAKEFLAQELMQELNNDNQN